MNFKGGENGNGECILEGSRKGETQNDPGVREKPDFSGDENFRPCFI